MLLDSADWADPYIFLRFLKKLPDRWEKPTLKEGKIIKINLLELIAILRVCHTPGGLKFETFHKFQGNNTQIRFEKKSEGQLVVSITGYQKYLNADETDLLTRLLDHLMEEKIIHATGFKDSSKLRQSTGAVDVKDLPAIPRPESLQTPPKKPVELPKSAYSLPPQETPIDPTKWLAALQQEKEFKLVPGEILAKSERAISFQVAQFNPIWVPLSCVGPEPQAKNSLWVKEWFLRKKLGDIFPMSA